jgi:hypothetical protein
VEDFWPAPYNILLTRLGKARTILKSLWSTVPRKWRHIGKCPNKKKVDQLGAFHEEWLHEEEKSMNKNFQLVEDKENCFANFPPCLYNYQKIWVKFCHINAFMYTKIKNQRSNINFYNCQ